ncbi:hypothetical protein ACLOJK_021039 [Asimina triloba]
MLAALGYQQPSSAPSILGHLKVWAPSTGSQAIPRVPICRVRSTPASSAILLKLPLPLPSPIPTNATPLLVISRLEMDPPLVHESSFTSSAAPSSYGLPEIWQLDPGSVLRRGHFGQNLSFPEPPGPAGNGSIEESTVTEQSGGHAGRKKRRDAAAVAASEDESSKLASTCSGNDAVSVLSSILQLCSVIRSGLSVSFTDFKQIWELYCSARTSGPPVPLLWIDCNGKRLKPAGSGEENGDLKADAEASSGYGNKTAEQNAQPSEAPKQDYIHVRARRGQATDSHSLAERILKQDQLVSLAQLKLSPGVLGEKKTELLHARREKISERMKILQDLVPGCNKVIGKALVLDEIINYIQSLQRQVEFLSMKLEAVNSRMNTSMDVFPAKDRAEDMFREDFAWTDLCQCHPEASAVLHRTAELLHCPGTDQQFGVQTFDASGMPFSSQPPREYGQESPSEWLHMQVGGGGVGFDRAT